jgi:hypothetical protein
MGRFSRSLLVAAGVMVPALLSAQATTFPQVRTITTTSSSLPGFPGFLPTPSNQFTFSQFNPWFGTLQRVRLELTGSQTFSTTVTPTLFQFVQTPGSTFGGTFSARYVANRSLSGQIRIPSVGNSVVFSPVLGGSIVQEFDEFSNPDPVTSEQTFDFSQTLEFTSGAFFDAFLGVSIDPIAAFFQNPNRISINASGFVPSLSGQWTQGFGTTSRNDRGSFELRLSYEYAPHPVVVPEPGTALLLAGGVLGLVVGMRRRRVDAVAARAA